MFSFPVSHHLSFLLFLVDCSRLSKKQNASLDKRRCFCFVFLKQKIFFAAKAVVVSESRASEICSRRLSLSNRQSPLPLNSYPNLPLFHLLSPALDTPRSSLSGPARKSEEKPWAARTRSVNEGQFATMVFCFCPLSPHCGGAASKLALELASCLFRPRALSSDHVGACTRAFSRPLTGKPNHDERL